jgi:hypothetical protein
MKKRKLESQNQLDRDKLQEKEEAPVPKPASLGQVQRKRGSLSPKTSLIGTSYKKKSELKMGRDGA